MQAHAPRDGRRDPRVLVAVLREVSPPSLICPVSHPTLDTHQSEGVVHSRALLSLVARAVAVLADVHRQYAQ